MPYFYWHGIDLNGNLCDGHTFARTQQEFLITIQLEQIKLIYWTHKKFFLRRNISLAQQIYIFKQLAILIDSGVLVTDAFLLVIKQLPQRSAYTSTVLFTILANIQIGMSCAQAFGIYENIFGKLTIALIKVAEETGQLAVVLNLIGSYWQNSLHLRRQIRSALMVPGITIFCFLVLLFLLMYWIVPTFATLLQTSGKPLPTITTSLLKMSAWVSSLNRLHVVLVILMGTISYWIITNNNYVQYQVHKVALKVPLLCTIIQLTISIGIAQSLSILMNGGVPLVSALYLARDVIHNRVIASTWDRIIKAVEDGMPLSNAMRQHGAAYFTDDFITLVTIGEESERLDILLARVVNVLKERLDTITNIITQLIQPLCMIVWGGLIAFLIVAIYVPLFDISNVITT